jgi:hypothetical protein
MPYLEIIIALVFAIAFKSGGDMEGRIGNSNHGLLWAALSIGVSALVVGGLGRGWVALILAQLALFVAIGAARVMLEERDSG